MDTKAQKTINLLLRTAKDAVITGTSSAVTDPKHALLTAAVAGGVSGVWEFLGFFSDKDKKRVDKFGDDLLLALRNLPDEKLATILNEDSYRTLIRKIIFAVYQEYNDEKIQCFHWFLVNVANDEPSDMDTIHHLEGILERLSVFHIRVLRVLWNPDSTVKEIRLNEDVSIQKPTTLDDKVLSCFPSEQRDVILSALVEIEVWNLTKERAGNVRNMHYTMQSFIQTKHLSSLGEKLIYLILSSSKSVSISK